MHIEPGVVTGAKAILGAVTAAGAGACSARLVWDALKENGLPSLVARSAISTGLVLAAFQMLPHPLVGVSEVHLILGSTLFLVFGAGPAALGLSLGLLMQGLLFAPFDLPQYGMNVTTLLVPLFALQALSRRIIAPDTAYVNLRYRQVLALSATYQGGIVAWVAFWALYGHGATTANLAAISAFASAYLLVIVVEPLVDLAVLAGAKGARWLNDTGITAPRLYASA